MGLCPLYRRRSNRQCRLQLAEECVLALPQVLPKQRPRPSTLSWITRAAGSELLSPPQLLEYISWRTVLPTQLTGHGLCARAAFCHFACVSAARMVLSF